MTSKSRREKGSGGIRELTPGVWELKYDIGRDPITNKRQTRYKRFRGKRKDALAELRRLVAAVDDGQHIDPTNLSVALYLDQWIDHMTAHWSPTTIQRNKQLCEHNIKPQFGKVKLKALSTHQLDAGYTALMQKGRADGKGGLSAQTTKHVHRLLSQALKQAVKWKYITSNPADDARVPTVPRKERKTLTVDQTLDLLESMRGHRYFIPTMIAVFTGLRRGEVLALKWKSLDLENGVLTVRESLEQTRQGLRYKTPKNGRTRPVALSGSLVAELRSHRTQQALDLLRKGIRQTGETLISCRPDGSELNPEDLSRRFPEVVKRMGLPRITFHELRHTHATQLLEAGVHMKITSERLGHSDIGITMNLYSHVVDGMQKEAVDLLDNTINSARNARPMAS